MAPPLFSSVSSRIIGSVSVFVVGGFFGIGGAICSGIAWKREDSILSNCCQTIFRNATQGCVKVVGELAYDAIELAELCERTPDEKDDKAYHTALFTLVGAVCMVAGLFFFTKTLCDCKRRPNYTQLGGE